MNMNENSIRVLLIEDNPGDVRLIEEMLREAKGRKIILDHCATLVQGLEELLKNTYNVMLLDLSLPDSKGFNTFIRVFSTTPQIPIVVLTGTNDEELAVKSVRTGAQDYLVKGHIDGSLLIRSISYAIERAGLLRVVQQELIERKAMESMLRKVNRALRMLSECNEIVVRATEEDVLAEKICRTITTVGEYQFAWIAFTEPDDGKSIQPIAIAGSKDGNSPEEASAWFKRDPDSPLREALTTGKVIVCDDVTVDKRCSNLRAEADKLGYRSFVILPLLASGRTLGILQICSREPDRFDREELKLLDELKEDIAYATVSIRTEKERRRAEEAMRDSEARYRMLFEASADGILIADIETKTFKYANPALCRMLGYTEEELRTLGLADIHPKQDLQRVIAEFETQARGDKTLALDIPCLRKDGRILYADINTTNITIDGRPYNVGLFRDITERKRADLTLQESEGKYRTFFNTSRDCVFITSVDGNWIDLNDAAIELFGYSSREELMQVKISSLYVNAEDRAKHISVIAERGYTKDYPVDLRKKDGVVIHTLITSAVQRDADSHVIGFMGTIRDITERKRAEETLTLFRHTFKSIHECISITDSENNLLFVNQAFIDTYGYTENELIGKSIYLVRVDSRLSGDEVSRKTLNGGWQGELLNRRKDGTVFPVSLSTSVVYDEKKQPIALVGAAVDITERKRAEEELKKSEGKFRAIFDNASDGMFLVDLKTQKFFICNTMCVKMLGYTQEEFSTLDIADIHPRENLPFINEQIGKFSKGEEGIRSDIRFKRKDGSIFAADLSPALLTIAEKKYLLLIFRDITERKRAEEALQEREEKYRSIFENVQDMYYETLIDGTILEVSPSIEIMSKGQYHRNDLIGKSMYDFYSDVGERQALLKALKERGSVTDFEVTLKNRNGSLIPCSISSKIQFNVQGNPEKIIGSMRDITERKQAEGALQKSEENFQSIMSSINDIVYSVDGKTQEFIYLSPAFEKLLGYTMVDIQQMGGRQAFLSQVIQDGKFTEQDNTFKQMQLVKGAAPTWESWWRCKDGRLLCLEDRSVPVYDGVHLVSTQGILSDITKRKQDEEALRETRDYLENLLSFANAPIIVWDSDFRITRFNVAFERLTGYSMYEVIGKHPEMFFPAVTQEASLASIRQTSRGDHLVSVEIPICCKDGSVRIVLWNSANIYATDNRTIIATIAHGLDITERKHAEEERNKLQAELIQAQKMESMGTLASGIAHDFNNILAIILGYSSLLEKRKLDDQKYAESISAINKAVQRGAELVRQILTFARKTDVVFGPVNFTDIIRELLSMLRQTFPKIITFTEAIEKDLPYIQADRTQIHQVLLNLCVNARDAMPNGGSITIRTEKQTKEQIKERFPFADQYSYICLSVTDTGQGMDEGTRVKVFDPFFTTKAGGKGTGLGLSVVYGVMQTHKGFIDLESERGRGTTFRLYFPIPATNERAISSQQYSKSFEEGGTETILLVEDEDLLIEMMRSLLETKGYTVHIAHDGIEAIEVYKKHQQDISLVLTDMGLPVMTGMDEFKKLKEINPYVKVIFASGYFESDVKSELLKAGAKGFIQKPYTTGNVLQTLRHVLDGK